MLPANKILTDLVTEYCTQYSRLRREHESLNNLDFNNECGLRLRVPNDWNAAEAVVPQVVIKFPEPLIVYHTAEEYTNLTNMLETVCLKGVVEPGVTYISWHEIYFALYNKGRDTRPLQRVNQLLNSSTAVVVCSASSLDQEVLYHIQTFASGCLICLD